MDNLDHPVDNRVNENDSHLPPPGWQVAGAALAYYPTETPVWGRITPSGEA